MPVGDHSRKALTISPDESVRSAAQRMAKDGVGCLVVTRQEQPIGILTDRDVALRVLRQKLDAGAVKVSDLMQSPVATIAAGAPLVEAMRTLRTNALRRLPVVDEQGKLVGVVTLDDLLRVVASELGDLAEAVRAQLAGETVPTTAARPRHGGSPA